MIALVVDDEDAIVQLLEDILIDEGVQVETAYNGRIALSKLEQGLRPNIMISDIMMPELDGWALYRALRQQLQLRSVGVILMSANCIRPLQLDDPATRFIAKPFEINEILTVVEELCAC